MARHQIILLAGHVQWLHTLELSAHPRFPPDEDGSGVRIIKIIGEKTLKRRLLIGLAVLVGIAIIVMIVANPIVSAILRSERHTLLSNKVMLITMKKRGTSELKTFPVDYLREAGTVYAGADSGWWKHLEGGAQVRMLIQGNERVGWAMPILDDPGRTTAGFKKLRPWTYKRALWTDSVFIEIRVQDGAN